MKQTNTSGAAVHVPSLELDRLVGPGEEVDAEVLLPGFTAAPAKQAAPRVKKPPAKKAAPVNADPTPEPTAPPTEDNQAAPAAEDKE